MGGRAELDREEAGHLQLIGALVVDEEQFGEEGQSIVAAGHQSR